MKKLNYYTKRILYAELVLIFACLILKITHFGGITTSILFAIGSIGMIFSIILILIIIYNQIFKPSKETSQMN
ncbi:putative YccA/Bax inhibitor family protein [Pedobacter zeae]|uniref:Putative YccA/Bax inhibitor family protein n=1 Tax=Pedobacter zeae TaxID=1737356 RepID=A0A7W6KCU4_9SPHI|nr:putative YccA/Bax inhibitor family protein [Pedobacter zeae]